MIMGEQTHVQNKLIGERTVAGANEPVTTLNITSVIRVILYLQLFTPSVMKKKANQTCYLYNEV